MKNGFIKKLSDSKNVKYTTVNYAFCALVLAIVILLNATFTVLAGKFNWFLDMTDEGIFTMSEQLEGAVEDALDGNDAKIEIIFALPKSEVENAFATTTTEGAIGYVNSTAEQLELKFDDIDVVYKDIRKEYAFFKENFYSESGASLSQSMIIVARKNADGTYAEYRTFDFRSFYGYASDNTIYAYNGEMVFASAICGLVLDQTPTVYFTVNHGEKAFRAWNDESVKVDNSNVDAREDIHTEAHELMKIFALCGYNVLPIDLATENIPADARSIIINQPKYDFTTEEIDKVRAYFKNSGTVYCFTNSTAKLTNLYEFAETEFGVSVTPLDASKTPVKDPASAAAGGNAFSLRPIVPSNSATSRYFKSLSAEMAGKAFVNNANIITINNFYLSDQGYAEGEFLKYAQPILVTDENAEFNGEKGVYTLATVTAAIKTSEQDLMENYSYFLMCPTDSFALSDNLSSNAYANRDMMMSLVQTLSARETTPSLVDIDFKTFINYKLDLTQRQANVTTILMVTVIPVALAICGTVIIRRRKLR